MRQWLWCLYTGVSLDSCGRLMKNSCVDENRGALKTRLLLNLFQIATQRAIIIIVSRNSKTCVQAYTEPQRGRNKFIYLMRWQGCACLQHFSSADLCGGCPEFQFAWTTTAQILNMYARVWRCTTATCAKTTTWRRATRIARKVAPIVWQNGYNL